MSEEIWKDIKDFEGLYQVSNYGNVRSLDRIVKCKGAKNIDSRLAKGKNIKQHKSNVGYLRVQLSKNNKIYNKLIHRLVAETFIENVNNDKYVNHKDENKENNKVENLEWCTHKYNCNYGNRNKILSIIASKPRNRRKNKLTELKGGKVE